jgi:hypothetical protein
VYATRHGITLQPEIAHACVPSGSYPKIQQYELPDYCPEFRGLVAGAAGAALPRVVHVPGLGGAVVTVRLGPIAAAGGAGGGGRAGGMALARMRAVADALRARAGEAG